MVAGLPELHHDVEQRHLPLAPGQSLVVLCQDLPVDFLLLNSHVHSQNLLDLKQGIENQGGRMTQI